MARLKASTGVREADVMLRPIATALAVLITTPVSSETVDVKYRGIVDLKPFACTDTPRSGFIQRVCYDRAESYMLINLRETYYYYCELPPATFDAFMIAPSMGQFYKQRIKGSGLDGPFDCTTHRLVTLNGIAWKWCFIVLIFSARAFLI
jgi:hypothetical protein